jgi:EAL domain-containing protein (putative c-di-GMP-specific phosphodiesterase class I)/GGDEF domain-containing protein
MSLLSAKKKFRCRLCVKITVGVFALILAIESILLVPSAWRFEETETERHAEHIRLVVDSQLILGPGLSGEGPLTRDLAAIAAQHQLEGLNVSLAGGRVLATIGASEILTRDTHAVTLNASDTRTMNTPLANQKLLTRWHRAGPEQQVISVISDVSYIRTALLAYLARVSGLIFLIVLVVTIGTMLLLYRLLLRPILSLRAAAVAAGESPRDALQYQLSTTRKDELGNLIDAFNVMLQHVSASMAREAAQAKERERYLARHNTLNGLPNRLAVIEHGENLVKTPRVPNEKLAIFIIKFIDNGIQHSSADSVSTRAMALTMRATDSTDFIAELAPLTLAIVRSTQHAEAIRFAESFIVQASRANVDGMVAAPLDVRIGITETIDQDFDTEQLLAQAEFALARASADTTVRYRFFDPQLAEQARARQQLSQDLARALTTGELEVWYQPKVDLQNEERLASAEALIRWPHATQGMISPAEFIPLAEATGQIQTLDRYVLARVCAQIAAWQRQFGFAPRVAVNLSANHFVSPKLADELDVMLRTHGVKPSQLEVEITETSAMQNSEATIRTLQRLRAIGIHTAIDDFGTGYSSLAYLRLFAVDTIKIDRSFVEPINADTDTNAPSKTICNAVLKLGHALGARVVAEGIETPAQADFLRALGCDEGQGYLFGRAVNAQIFAKTWLGKSQAALLG